MRASSVLSRPAAHRVLALVALSAVMAPALASAQLVTPKTVPVLQDEQFDLYPSSRPGLGGVSLALDDSLADPFTNPAKALRLRGVHLVVMPYSHEIAVNNGGGRTVPVTLMASRGDWAGALVGAFQQIHRAGPVWNRPQSERMANNRYVTAVAARRLGAGLSLGGSAAHASLGAVDGVDLMYGGSDRIDQDGSMTDLRLGAVKEWAPGHALELLALHNRTTMTHDVHFTTWRWDPATRRSTSTQRQELNRDETRIAGLHSEYTVPFGTRGWRFGALATANRLGHPKIPNYSFQNIPRDPGNTNAYNLGVGLAREAGPLTFAADVIIEPMNSDTWADRATDTTTARGAIFRAGARTVENHFEFRNHKLRLGVGRRFDIGRDSGSSIAVNLGLSMYAIDYSLLQNDLLRATVRTQKERWTEWMPGAGVRYRSRELEVSYAYRRNCGNEDCATRPDLIVADAGRSAPLAGGVIGAPSGPLFFRSGVATSHRVMMTVPLLWVVDSPDGVIRLPSRERRVHDDRVRRITPPASPRSPPAAAAASARSAPATPPRRSGETTPCPS